VTKMLLSASDNKERNLKFPGISKEGTVILWGF